MAVQVRNIGTNNLVEIQVSGKLVKADYETFVPQLEKLIRDHGKLRILFEMKDFHGWTMSALWEDFKFDLKHFRDVERVAMLGDKKWEQGMAIFCKPFTTAKIKYFDHTHHDEALTWLAENKPSHVKS
jgi:hypothetical protein